MSKFLQLFTLLLLLPLSHTQAATYYLANTGQDDQDGLSEATAWQNIDKLNSVILEDNSTVLFKRGDLFRGSISTNKSPKGIQFGNYGTGENPIIAGSVSITQWQPTTHPALTGRPIYEAKIDPLQLTDTGIEHLFVNGQLMTLARYPNVEHPKVTHWLHVGAQAGNDAFTDPALVEYGKPNNYWTGATLRIRNYSWTYTVLEITGYEASTGKITAKGLEAQLPEWGYFLDNKLEELDFPGEWYYDPTAQTVYLYPPTGTDPNAALIEGTTHAVGLKITNAEDNTRVENLTFRHFTQRGIEINGSANVTLQNNHLEHNSTGIYVWNSPNALVTGNTLDNQLLIGIVLQAQSGFDVQNSRVEHNRITNTSMYPLYGQRYAGAYQGIAINVAGRAYTVRQNTIENTCWNGIYLKDDGHHLIENNTVRKSLLLLNDGGAISISSDGNTIRGNLLFESLGNVDESNGCGSTVDTPCMHHPTYGMGIGADNNFKDNIIENNIVANNPDMGIRLNAFLNTTVRNNLIYNNESQLVIEDKKGPSRNNTIEGNLLFSLDPDQRGLVMTNDTDHGQFSNNHYCNPFSEIVIMHNNQRYSLAHWQHKFPTEETQSRQCTLHFEEFTLTKTGPNLIVNPNFDTDLNNWKGSGTATIAHNPTGLDNGSLALSYQGVGNANVIPTEFVLTANQAYQLQFTVLGTSFGNIQLRMNDAQPEQVSQILKERFFAFDTQRKDYELTFTSPLTTNFSKPLFITDKAIDAEYQLDNVTLVPVTAVLNDATQQARLLTNSTAQPLTIQLTDKAYFDLEAQPVTAVTLAPFSGQIVTSPDKTPIPPETTEPTDPTPPVDPTPTEETPPETVTEPTEPTVPTEPPIETPIPEETPPAIVVPPVAPLIPQPILTLPTCPSTGIINERCRGYGKTFNDLTVQNLGYVSDGYLAGHSTSQGWVSNLTINAGATFTGGIVTGYINNAGTMTDFEFLGARLTGGILSGTILNNSKVGGRFVDVQLAANTLIKGGQIQGRIVGDPLAPARLENVRILPNSHLSGIILGSGVTLADGVIVDPITPTEESDNEEEVEEPAETEVPTSNLPTLGETVAIDSQGQPTNSTSTFEAGIAINPNSTFLTQQTVNKLLDSITAQARINVDPAHIGQTADLFVYATYQLNSDTEPTYLMLGQQGEILTWDQNPNNLIALVPQVTLTAQQNVLIYQGILIAEGTVKVVVGYRLANGQVIHSGDTLELIVQ